MLLGGGHAEAAQWLLAHGTEVNARCAYGLTPFSYASKTGEPEALRVLLEHGAEVDPKDLSNRTPLFHAGDSGNHEALRVLLEYGAEVDSKDNCGAMSLMRTAPCYHNNKYSRNTDALQLLLEHGAKVSTKDNLGQTALFHILRSACSLNALALLLASGADANTKWYEGRTSLLSFISSCSYDNLEERTITFLKLIMSQKDFDINAKADDGSTVLSWAIREGFHELEKVLRANGAVDEDRPEGGLIEEE